MFTEKDNRTRVTCSSSSKKRSSENPINKAHNNNKIKTQKKKNKRVALGDITNDNNSTELPQNSEETNSVKCKSKPQFESIESLFVSSGIHKCTYSSSIYKYLRSLEIDERGRPMPNYMESVQNDVSAHMREVLVDWMMDVAEEYKLVSETLYLSVSCVDKFLSLRALDRSKLQLLGVSCMLVSSKYEEIQPPSVEEYCYITDNAYTKEEVLNMEKDVLKLLNFGITAPTVKSFLRIFTRAALDDGKVHDSLQFELLSCYLSDLSLLEYKCVRFLQSIIAASTIFLTDFTIQPHMHPWSETLQCCSGYEPSDLKECVLAIHEWQLSRRGSHLTAVRYKYLQHKYKQVASLSSPSEIPAHYFEATYE